MKTANGQASQAAATQRARQRLVEELRRQGVANPRVLQAIEAVPRHLFMDSGLAHCAYRNQAFPIGHGQTISQPAIVARITQVLLLEEPMRKVLEIGTGSGWQAAILDWLGMEVYTIERIAPLYQEVRRRLSQLGFHRTRTRLGDGYKGWPGQAPFDGILLSAAPEAVPHELFAQLRDGGVLIAPVGPEGNQRLKRHRRQGMQIRVDDLGAVAFVPMLPDVQK